MYGKCLIIALIGVGVSLGGPIIDRQRTTNRAIAELRTEVSSLRDRMSSLEPRMARLEGLFEGFTNREAAR